MKTTKWLRILCALLTFVFVMGAFTACGDNKKDETPSDPPAPDTSDPDNNKNNPEFDPAVDSDVKPIKLNIGSYNIANGSKVDHDFKKLAADILSANLDVVGLQEVDINCDRSGNIETIKELSKLTGYQYYCFFKAINLGSGEYGNAILSKYPIVENERIELYSTGEQRVVGRAKIDVNGTMINFFTTHLEWSPDSTRYKQMEQLNELLPQYDNFVIVGDFNVHELTEYRTLTYKGMVNTEEKPILTYSSYDGEWYLDNIIYSPDDWTFTEAKTLPNGNSDHFMLWSTGTFAQRGREVFENSKGEPMYALTDGLKGSSSLIGKWAAGTEGAYVQLDLGCDYSLSSLNVVNATTRKNVYKWAAYATNDASLPIDQWVKLGEKTDDSYATGAGYTLEMSEKLQKEPLRYIRIYGTYHSESPNYRIAEITVTGKAIQNTDKNLAESAKVTGSSGKPFFSLNDSDLTKYVKVGQCGAGTTGAYIEIDLGEVSYLSALKLMQPYKGSPVYKWAAYGTDDNTKAIGEWTKLGEKSNDSAATSDGYTLKITGQTSEKQFRYVRIYGIASSDGNEFKANEVMIYGVFVSDATLITEGIKASAGNGVNCDSILDGSTSGYFDLGYWASNVADAPFGTEGTCYVEIDLGKLYNLDKLKVVNLVSATRIYKWEAFISADKDAPISEWTSVGGKTNDDTASDRGYTVNFTAEQKAEGVQYIRIYGMYHNTNIGYHISEVFVSGTPAA